MHEMTKAGLFCIALGALGALCACDEKPKRESSDTPGITTAASARSDPATAKPALVLSIAYGSEKKTWLEDQIGAFGATSPKTASGRPIKVDAKAMGSGEAMQSILNGSFKAHVFSPASGLYVTLLNDAWQKAPGHTKPIAKGGEPLVLSPVVIAMWKPMAEALGWPKKQLSWSDLLKVSTNPKGWGALGFPEWGKFKLGHCHPEFSNSGYLAVVAEAYAGAKKTRGLTTADVDAKATADFVAQVESTIVHYGKSTGFFADKMVSRGPSYLSAAVLYENLVIEAYAKSPAPPVPIVAVYPTEGTFWSDHPYAILDADWVGTDERQAAEAFLAFLKARPAQERALSFGFRPADPAVAVASPIDPAHGVDPKQPQTILPVPDAAVLAKLLALWQVSKKGADVIFVFDKSGSMAGRPLQEAKAGATRFLETLQDRDEVTLMFFDGTVYPPVGPLRLGPARAQIQQRFDAVTAGGGTALYDAIALAFDLASAHAKDKPQQIHAVMVMTDGKDEGSKMSLSALEGRFPKEGEAQVKVFTIAYGAEAEGAILERIAEAAKGSSAKGSVDTIKDVYLDMASFF
jgi:Ca-activated chloride channel family protein